MKEKNSKFIYKPTFDFLTEAINLGGKASNLLLLNKIINVPGFFVVSAKALKYYLQYHSIEDIYWANISSGNHEKNYYLFDKNLPVILLEQIKENVDVLGTNFYSVRSSARYEDGEKYSYAGIYKTNLFVTKDDIPKSILDCWASLFSKEALSYSKSINKNNNDDDMNVIIQKMICPEISGVIFSEESRNNFYIEAVEGVGEKFVDGSTIPTRICVHRKTKKIEVMRDEGKFAKKLFKLIDELIIIVNKIEKLFKTPQDIEWAYDGNIWVLQSRHVTASVDIVNDNISSLLDLFNNTKWDLQVPWNSHSSFPFLFIKGFISNDYFPLEVKNSPIIYKNKIWYFSKKMKIESFKWLKDNGNNVNNISLKIIGNYYKLRKLMYSQCKCYTDIDRDIQKRDILWNLYKMVIDTIERFYSVRAVIPPLTKYIERVLITYGLKKELNFVVSQHTNIQVQFHFDLLKVSSEIEKRFEKNRKPLSNDMICKLLSEDDNINKHVNSLINNYKWMVHDEAEIIELILKNNKNAQNQYKKLIANKEKKLNYYNSLINSLDKTKKDTMRIYEDLLFIRTDVNDIFSMYKNNFKVLFNSIAQRLEIPTEGIYLLNTDESKHAIIDNVLPDYFMQRIDDVILFLAEGKINLFSGATCSLFNFIKGEKANPSTIVGDSVYQGYWSGRLKIINNVNDIENIEENSIICVYKLYPWIVPYLSSKIKGIISDRGGLFCHAALIARELNIPCIVGTNIFYYEIIDGEEVTFDARHLKGIVVRKVLENK